MRISCGSRAPRLAPGSRTGRSARTQALPAATWRHFSEGLLSQWVWRKRNPGILRVATGRHSPTSPEALLMRRISCGSRAPRLAQGSRTGRSARTQALPAATWQLFYRGLRFLQVGGKWDVQVRRLSQMSVRELLIMLRFSGSRAPRLAPVSRTGRSVRTQALPAATWPHFSTGLTVWKMILRNRMSLRFRVALIRKFQA